MLNVNFQIPEDKIARISAAFKVSTVEEFKTVLIAYIKDTVKAYEQGIAQEAASEAKQAQVNAAVEAAEAIEEDNDLLS